MPPPVLTPRAWIEIALLALIWGASFLSIKVALGELPVMTLVAHRVFWACLILWAYVLWTGLPVPKQARVWSAFLVMGALNNAIPFGLMAWGQQFIETGLTAILNATTAVFGVLVAAIAFRDERLTFRRATGVAIAFGGVVVAIGPSALSGLDLRSLAQLAVIGGTLSYAIAASWARAQLSQLDPEVAAAGMLTGSSLLLLPLARLVDGAPVMPALPATWLAIGYFSVIGTSVAYLLYYRILRVAGSGNAMLVTLLIPPVAILLGAAVLHERLAPSAFAGFALIALGLLVLDGRVFAAKIPGARLRRPR
ncbi:EamA family transporter [Rhodobacterales bacterium HKCCE3408]|nr:EamA family transporter [Rhodobacterales bacterium HKCCE3408]